MSNVSIIVINYNGKELITDCLEALERQGLKDFEIVVVDNGSSDDSLYEIHRFLEESPIASLVKLIPLSRNAGFAGGNLEGLKHACGEYIAPLSSDAEPDSDIIKTSRRMINGNTRTGHGGGRLSGFGVMRKPA